MTTTKEVLGITASLALIGVIVYGKWKLLATPAVGFMIVVGAIVFMISTPARAE